MSLTLDMNKRPLRFIGLYNGRHTLVATVKSELAVLSAPRSAMTNYSSKALRFARSRSHIECVYAFDDIVRKTVGDSFTVLRAGKRVSTRYYDCAAHSYDEMIVVGPPTLVRIAIKGLSKRTITSLTYLFEKNNIRIELR